MPDIARILDMKFCHSSYEEPIANIGGWRLFMDGFIGSANNTKLVGRILAWNKEVPRYYISVVGTPDGAFEYQKGDTFPPRVIDECQVNTGIATMGRNFMFAYIRKEIDEALERLVSLIAERESVMPVSVAIPDYPVSTCTCCGQSLPEDVLRRMGL